METRGRQMLAAVAAAGTIAATLPALSLSVGVASAGQGDSVSGLASCSKATALKIATQLQVVPDPTLPSPVASTLCGSFTGPGSQAMVAVFARGTCLPSSGWAVFRLTGGAWRLVLQQTGVSTLVAAGSDIRETVPVWRPIDPPCNAGGGTKARSWHWNGTRLVAGPWKQVTPPDTLRYGSFKTPSANIVCDYSVQIGSRASESSVGCVIKSGLRPAPPRRPCQDGGYAGDRVYVGVTGRVEVPPCAGDPGPYVNVERARVLGYGSTWSGGGFRCTSAEVGLTCRNKSGHGFFLSRERWRIY
jgi:hypothetical protein